VFIALKIDFKLNGDLISQNVTMDSVNLFATPVNDWRSEKAPPNIHICEIPSCIFVPTMPILCCIPYVHVSCWFSKTIFTTCDVFICLFLICWDEMSIMMMDANQLLNSLHPLPTWCSLSTLSPNTTINWQWISRVKMFCLYKLSQHKVFCITQFPLTLQLQVNLSPK